jgi:hypothetical protein
MPRIITLTARACWVGTLTVLAMALCTAVALGQTDREVVRVEQDWELVVGTPDPASDGPQVTCVTSPVGNVESLHATLEVNVQTLGCYAPGGLQLQLWDGESPVSDHASHNHAVLSTPGETVTWTQSMEVRDGLLIFAISNGNSVTWGQFGRSGYFSVWTPTTLVNLNGYNSDVSVHSSGAGFADNRVQSLMIRRVRYYTSTGEQIEDTEPEVIHSQPAVSF